LYAASICACLSGHKVLLPVAWSESGAQEHSGEIRDCLYGLLTMTGAINIPLVSLFPHHFGAHSFLVLMLELAVLLWPFSCTNGFRSSRATMSELAGDSWCLEVLPVQFYSLTEGQISNLHVNRLSCGGYIDTVPISESDRLEGNPSEKREKLSHGVAVQTRLSHGLDMEVNSIRLARRAQRRKYLARQQIRIVAILGTK
jgi:hypothetical protein